jgi:hypothetical protein
MLERMRVSGGMCWTSSAQESTVCVVYDVLGNPRCGGVQLIDAKEDASGMVQNEIGAARRGQEGAIPGSHVASNLLEITLHCASLAGK